MLCYDRVIAVFAALQAINLVASAPHRAEFSATAYGKRLESLYRLGLDKEGIASWDPIDSEDAGLLRINGNQPLIEYVKAEPQLAGNMGNAQPPRQLQASEQFRPEEYDPPRPGVASAPGALKSLNQLERDEIGLAFLEKYRYSEGEEFPTIRKMVTKMQQNYGIDETGELNDDTVMEMLRPRCGTPDKPAEYRTFANREHWLNKDVSYRITGYSPDMSQCQIRNAIKRAFRVWEEVTDLTFTMVEEERADIIIYFGYEEHGDGYPFDGPNGLLAHAFSPGSSAISGDSHFDEGEFWTLGQGKVFDTYYGTNGGEPCEFPFYFEGKRYHHCTSDGRTDGLEWCATTADYDDDKKWAFCPHEKLFTYGGNANNSPCMFPFQFLGKTYDSCTYEGRSDGYRWCATTSSFEADQKWGFCPDRAHGTEGGNSGGASCVFPFVFEGMNYTKCTTRGRSDYKLWCGTTSNYDNDGQWGFCTGNGYSLFLVAAHEFGHAIGLDHSSVKDALMYPSYSYKPDLRLPEDDTRGARDLYGGPRTKPLLPLQLERCGGDLTTTEVTTTKGIVEPVTTTTSTSTESTTTRGGKVTTPAPPPITTTRSTIDKCDDSVKPTTICERPIDAIFLYQAELFIFQGPFLWRISGKGRNQRRSLLKVRQLWPELPCGVDAAYQRPFDEKLVFFKGGEYYEYSGTSVESGYPRDVTELGLPARSVVDDVVFMEAKNKATGKIDEMTFYFIGDKVYRADNENGKVLKELDGKTLEPETLGESRHWSGLPANIDAVYRESLTRQYLIFVKGNEVLRYANKPRSVKPTKSGRPLTTKKLFGC